MPGAENDIAAGAAGGDQPGDRDVALGSDEHLGVRAVGRDRGADCDVLIRDNRDDTLAGGGAGDRKVDDQVAGLAFAEDGDVAAGAGCDRTGHDVLLQGAEVDMTIIRCRDRIRSHIGTGNSEMPERRRRADGRSKAEGDVFIAGLNLQAFIFAAGSSVDGDTELEFHLVVGRRDPDIIGKDNIPASRLECQVVLNIDIAGQRRGRRGSDGELVDIDIVENQGAGGVGVERDVVDAVQQIVAAIAEIDTDTGDGDIADDVDFRHRRGVDLAVDKDVTPDEPALGRRRQAGRVGTRPVRHAKGGDVALRSRQGQVEDPFEVAGDSDVAIGRRQRAGGAAERVGPAQQRQVVAGGEVGAQIAVAVESDVAGRGDRAFDVDQGAGSCRDVAGRVVLRRREDNVGAGVEDGVRRDDSAADIDVGAGRDELGTVERGNVAVDVDVAATHQAQALQRRRGPGSVNRHVVAGGRGEAEGAVDGAAGQQDIGAGGHDADVRAELDLLRTTQVNRGGGADLAVELGAADRRVDQGERAEVIEITDGTFQGELPVVTFQRQGVVGGIVVDHAGDANLAAVGIDGDVRPGDDDVVVDDPVAAGGTDITCDGVGVAGALHQDVAGAGAVGAIGGDVRIKLGGHGVDRDAAEVGGRTDSRLEVDRTAKGVDCKALLTGGGGVDCSRKCDITGGAGDRHAVGQCAVERDRINGSDAAVGGMNRDTVVELDGRSAVKRDRSAADIGVDIESPGGRVQDGSASSRDRSIDVDIPGGRQVQRITGIDHGVDRDHAANKGINSDAPGRGER